MAARKRTVNAGRRSKRISPTRTADEFNTQRLLFSPRPPSASPNVFAWLLDAIRAARDDQQRGIFKRPAALAKGFRTDDALFTAYRNRLAPLKSLANSFVPAADNPKAKSICAEAVALYGPNGPALTQETLTSIHGELVDHGLAIGMIDQQPRDGTRMDLYLHHWPIEWVRWDTVARCLMTQIEYSDDSAGELEAHADDPDFRASMGQVPIVHGDGRWIVFATRETEPWAHEACLIPAALVWAARAFGLRDWAQNSQAHGAAKMIGELPEGIGLTDGEGNATPEAAAFLALLDSVMASTSLTGIRPFGSKTDWIANGSTNWQIFTELVSDRAKSAARIYLGTDGILGAQGGAPGVDISALFGIATTILQSDTSAIEKGLNTGLFEPWCAINFGDSKLAPKRLYELPDADAERWNEDFAKRNSAFHAAIKDTRSNGFEITQDVVQALAAKYRVPAPTLPEQADRAPTIALAPTDLAVAVKVNEARASAGLGPLTLPDGSLDPDGLLPLSAYKAKVESSFQAAPAQPPVGAPAKPNGAPANA
jgi:hypothetical protein